MTTVLTIGRGMKAARTRHCRNRGRMGGVRPAGLPSRLGSVDRRERRKERRPGVQAENEFGSF